MLVACRSPGSIGVELPVSKSESRRARPSLVLGATQKLKVSMGLREKQRNEQGRETDFDAGATKASPSAR